MSLPAKVPLRLVLPLPRTDAAGRAVLGCLCRGQKPMFDDGTFAVRRSLDEPMVLVAVRGTACSVPMPWTGAVDDLLLVLPE